jgi:hypothetical protein
MAPAPLHCVLFYRVILSYLQVKSPLQYEIKNKHNMTIYPKNISSKELEQ